MSRKPALAFIFVTLVLDILGIGLIVPILPALVEDLSGKGPADGARLYGALASVYALMQFLFAPLLGNLSDRFGRRRVILISLFGSAFDYCLMAWSPTLLLFFVGRVLSGISGANMAPATAYIADISPPEKRAANFGLIGAAFGLGFVLGPFLGGHLGEIHVRLPFWVAGGLSLLNAAYGFFVLPESLAKENRRSLEWQKANPLGMLQQLWRYPVVLGLAGTHFLISLAHQVFPSTWVLYTKHRFQWGPDEVGNSLGVVGVMAALVQGGLTRRLIPRLGEFRAAVFGLAIGAAAFLAYGLAGWGWQMYVIILVGSLASLANPSIQGMVSRAVGDNEQGAIQGAFASLVGLAGIFGPLIATGLFAWGVDESAGGYYPGAAFFFSAMLQVVALGLAFRAARGTAFLAEKERS